MVYTVSQYINGQFTSSADATTQPIINPATTEAIGQLKFATAEEVDAAVASALQAFPAWANTTPMRRARVLFKFKNLLENNAEELAQIVTAEHGKTLPDAMGSIQRGLELVEFACGIPNLLKGSYSENVGTDVDCYTVRQPLGVCVGVSPFNFPVMVPIWQFIWAIACGNTFILKPSEQDPQSVLRLAEMMTAAGLPDGVLNVVNGDRETVNQLITHKDVSAVTAVASTPVAKHIYETATQAGKRAHTFGGAKNHCVVMPDADLDEACEMLVGAAYGSAGERCMAVSVVVAVGNATADALREKICAKLPTLKVGPGTDANVEIGPLISEAHRDKVLSYIASGQEEGAELCFDGREMPNRNGLKGYFVGPCLFDNVQTSMKIYQEEIFGPVLCVVRVPDFASALELINRNPYGNGTAILTRNGEVAHQFAKQVQVGMVGINVPIPVPVAYHSFGGWKQSIFGDVDMHGEQSIQFYTQSKSISSRWPKGLASTEHFVMPTHN